jgi:hypothetical protein
MSSAAHFTGVVSENHGYQTQEIPASLKSNNSAQAIRANNRHFQLATSSSSQQSSGGVLLWQIPPTNGAISRETMYLRCRISTTGSSVAPTWASAATAVGFKGPGTLNAAYVPALSNGYSWIQRLTLYGTGSAVIDQMNYVNSTMDMLLAHNSNPTYLQGEAQSTMGIGRQWDVNGTQAYIDLCLPLPLSCFQNSQIDFPLFLARNPMTLQLDISSFARGLTVGASTLGTDFQVSNAYLCYEVLEVPHSLIEAERSAVQGGHPFIMPLQSWLNVQVPASVLSSYTLGLNASSLRSVYVSTLDAAAYASATVIKYARNAADSSTAWGSGVNAQLYLDGNVKNSSIFDTPVMQLIQLKQALHNNVQSSVIMPSVSTFATYNSDYFALGFDCTSFDDEATIFGGSPVSNVNIQLTGFNGSTGSNIANVLCLYDTLLAFSQDGVMEVKR